MRVWINQYYIILNYRNYYKKKTYTFDIGKTHVAYKKIQMFIRKWLKRYLYNIGEKNKWLQNLLKSHQ